MSGGEQTLEQKLRAWLREQGYPLEMRVARALQQASARVIQSEYYDDPITSEPREVDVLGQWRSEIEGVLVSVTLVIECKTSRDKPWLLFVSRETGLAAPARVAQRAASRLGSFMLSGVAKEAVVQNLPLFQLPKAPAYGIKQGLNDKVDVCYSAVASVSAATASLAAHDDFQDTRIGRRYFCEILFPVVVTEARLFTALLDDGGEIELQEQRSGVLLWRNQVVKRPHTIVHIVTAAELNAFVAMARASAEGLFKSLAGELKPTLVRASELRVRELKRRSGDGIVPALRVGPAGAQ